MASIDLRDLFALAQQRLTPPEVTSFRELFVHEVLTLPAHTNVVLPILCLFDATVAPRPTAEAEVTFENLCLRAAARIAQIPIRNQSGANLADRSKLLLWMYVRKPEGNCSRYMRLMHAMNFQGGQPEPDEQMEIDFAAPDAATEPVLWNAARTWIFVNAYVGQRRNIVYTAEEGQLPAVRDLDARLSKPTTQLRLLPASTGDADLQRAAATVVATVFGFARRSTVPRLLMGFVGSTMAAQPVPPVRRQLVGTMAEHAQSLQPMYDFIRSRMTGSDVPVADRPRVTQIIIPTALDGFRVGEGVAALQAALAAEGINKVVRRLPVAEVNEMVTLDEDAGVLRRFWFWHVDSVVSPHDRMEMQSEYMTAAQIRAHKKAGTENPVPFPATKTPGEGGRGGGKKKGRKGRAHAEEFVPCRRCLRRS